MFDDNRPLDGVNEVTVRLNNDRGDGHQRVSAAGGSQPIDEQVNRGAFPLTHPRRGDHDLPANAVTPLEQAEQVECAPFGRQRLFDGLQDFQQRGYSTVRSRAVDVTRSIAACGLTAPTDV